MKASAHVFAIDLVDEGFGRVLDTARERGGLDGVVLAATYHRAFDLFPHNPVHRAEYHEGGAAYFHPDPTRYQGLRMQPVRSRLAKDVDPLGRLVEEASRRGMPVRAWTNHLQETDQGPRHPDTTVENAFGDRYPRWLCPANPDVRAYLAAISADIARYDIETLVLESMCYQPWDIIFSAGRSHFPYDPTARFFLSLCFCEHCSLAARTAGVRIAEVRAFAAAELARVLAGEPSAIDDVPLEPERIGALVGGEMGGLLDVRRSVVTSLIKETTDAVRRQAGSARVVVMEWSGGLASYKSGEAEGRATCERAWQDGVDLAAIAAQCDGIAMLGYTRDAERLRVDIAGYRALVPADRSVSVAMRPMPPDCVSAEELAGRVTSARAFDVDWLEFYHYGLMRLANLDWIRLALGA